MWEPSDDYEAYTRHQDTLYERLVAGKTHETCSHVDPENERPTDEDEIFCNKYEIYVSRFEYVLGSCDCYTED